ncbi:hypothetical protein G9A89_018857 [Geosiphon pyriformis]|nr:hypothetical protein G9A89_018857 [Geosiphon pyriformis]
MDLNNYSALMEFLGKRQYPPEYTQQQREHLIIRFEEREIIIYNMYIVTDKLGGYRK